MSDVGNYFSTTPNATARGRRTGEYARVIIAHSMEVTALKYIVNHQRGVSNVIFECLIWSRKKNIGHCMNTICEQPLFCDSRTMHGWVTLTCHMLGITTN